MNYKKGGTEKGVDDKFCKVHDVDFNCEENEKCGKKVLSENQKRTVKKILIFVAIVLRMSLSACLIVVILYIISPERKIFEYFDSGNYEAAVEYVEAEEVDTGKIKESMEKRIDLVYSKFQNKEIDYDPAILELEAIETMNISGLLDKIETVKFDINEINESRKTFSEADSLEREGKIKESILKYAEVSSKDKLDYEAAQNKKKDLLSEYKTSIIAEAKNYAAEASYEEAIDCLKGSQDLLKDDKQIEDLIETYIKEYKIKEN